MTELSATAPAKSSNPTTFFLWFHQRFGRPQVYALLLLTAFAGQCFFLAARSPISNLEMAYISPAHGADAMAGATGVSSPVVRFLAWTAALLAPAFPADSALWQMWLRAPFIIVGCLLGASLWYVSRRIYGNTGGYIALALYAFSPAMIQRWASVEPDVIAAWGAFGCIFTGIAVAHTLYAPREVVLWNYRRILLLTVAIGVAVAAVPAVILAVPLALLFMFYLVPHRRGAALVILGTATVLGLLLFSAMFSFDRHAISAFLSGAGGLQFGAATMNRGILGALIGGFVFRNGPAVTTVVVITFCIWLGWRRARFFGTAAPLIVAVVFMLVGLFLAHKDVLVFLEMALPFLFVFAAGVCADLMELTSTLGGIVKALVLATVVSNCLFSIIGLIRM